MIGKPRIKPYTNGRWVCMQAGKAPGIGNSARAAYADMWMHHYLGRVIAK